ncbi:MAG: hypothetical protein WCP98_21855 [Actinomycetes bacterium]
MAMLPPLPALLSLYASHAPRVKALSADGIGRHAVGGLAGIFAVGDRRGNDTAHEAVIKELHFRIGRLTVAKGFLGKAFGR